MLIEFDSGKFFKNRVAPRLDTMFHLNTESDVVEEYSKLMANGGRPIIYGNHQSHSDGWALGLAVQYLRSLNSQSEVNFPGIILPLARSIFTGDQGKILRAIINLSVPILEENGMKVLSYTRNKDVNKYGLAKNKMELRPMISLIKEGYGLGYLPEASIQGGRHKNFFGFAFGGEINGIIEVDDKSGFLDFYMMIQRYGQVKGEIFFLPIAMEGGCRFLGADIPIPTLELIKGLFINSTNPIQVTIERPITPKRLISELREDWQVDPLGLNDFLMKKVAEGLPMQSRGIYRKALDLEAVA